jgi:hypothetical protein
LLKPLAQMQLRLTLLSLLGTCYLSAPTEKINKSANNPLVFGSTSLTAVIERDVASPVQADCVNPVCTPGVPCPQYRCGPAYTIPTQPPQPTV